VNSFLFVVANASKSQKKQKKEEKKMKTPLNEEGE